ncbi:MAG: hypothetical protein E6R08_10095 [Nevskiaceae bacterium]|nr:MAG: hypothetical protein E6R08_10095 [Nevskiaceae bacterium]
MIVLEGDTPYPTVAVRPEHLEETVALIGEQLGMTTEAITSADGIQRGVDIARGVLAVHGTVTDELVLSLYMRAKLMIFFIIGPQPEAGSTFELLVGKLRRPEVPIEALDAMATSDLEMALDGTFKIKLPLHMIQDGWSGGPQTLH